MNRPDDRASVALDELDFFFRSIDRQTMREHVKLLRAEIARLREVEKRAAYMQRPAYVSARWALSVLLASLPLSDIRRVIEKLDAEECDRLLGVIADFQVQMVQDAARAATPEGGSNG
jgi:hypothetical protein